MDHTEYLGDTIEKIAFEKFSVVRDPSTSVYLGDNESLYKYFHGSILMRDALIRIISMSLQGNCYDMVWDKYQFNELKTSLIGEFQIYNSALAVAAAIIASARLPGINENSIRNGLSSADWIGRMELVPYDSGKKYFLFDGGHNEDGISKLTKSVRSIFEYNAKIAVVYAAMRDKDIFGCLSHINKLKAPIFLTEVPGNERSARIQDLKDIAGKLNWDKISFFEDPLDAINEAKIENDVVLICGSLYFIGYVRSKII
jgi:dihydrofolate synthase/folylpolyglutamate synthase